MSTPQQPQPYQPQPQQPQAFQPQQYQPRPYQPQQPAQPRYQPGPGVQPAPQRKAGLLDIHFTRFLSLTLITVWWTVALVLIGLGAIVGVIGGVTRMGDHPAIGILWMLGALIGSVVLAVLTRLFLESIAVLFRIADNTSEMAKRGG